MMLKRTILLLAGASLVVAIACGGGDKKDDSRDDEPDAPVATSAASDDDPTAEPEATAEASADDDDGGSGSGVFSSLLETAFGAGTGGAGAAGAGLGEGDPALLDYVLGTADLPDGYTSIGEFTFRAPDGVSETGGADMAASMAAAGDIASGDITELSMIMSMVMRFDDLTALGDALDEFDNLSEDDLQDAIAAGADLPLGIKFTNLELLDADGLGEGAAGMEMTIDMGELAETLGGMGGAGEDFPTQMTMRMYFFGRGEYLGAIMHMGFGPDLAPVDELALANKLDANLEAAQ